MSIEPTPELAAKLSDIARRRGRDLNSLANEVLAEYVEYDAWFSEKVQRGRAQLYRGEFISHDQVGAELDALLRS